MKITFPNADYSDWASLYDLVARAYAYMDGRIDPPSSFTRMSVADFATKAKDELLLTALEGHLLVACAFVQARGETAYIGKVAVAPEQQGQGVFKKCYAEIEAYARREGFKHLELECRIELTEVHAVYEKLGFVKTRERAHQGFARSTSIVMQKQLI